MKRYIPIFLSFFLACNQHVSTTGELMISNQHKIRDLARVKHFSRAFKTLDKNKILRRLFDSNTFDAEGNILWVPSYADQMEQAISYDYKCHTKVDTIMYYTNTEGEEAAVAILGTRNYRLDEESSSGISHGDCHFCGVPIGAALFHKMGNDVWLLDHFDKKIYEFGFYGSYIDDCCQESTIQLQQVGDQWTCLTFHSRINGQMGIENGYEIWFGIESRGLNAGYTEPLRSIFGYSYFFREHDFSDSLVELMTAQVELIPRLNNYSDIKLKRTKNGVESTERYSFNEYGATYILK